MQIMFKPTIEFLMLVYKADFIAHSVVVLKRHQGVF